MYLGGSITQASGWRVSTAINLDNKTPHYRLMHYNAGVGGTNSWYGLVRLQADVIDHSPQVVMVDFAVNDTGGDYSGTAEALIRRLRTSLPNARIYCHIFTWPDDYSYMSEERRASRDCWINIANTYGLHLLRFDTYLEDLMGVGYDDADVEGYFATNDVHPNATGYQAIADFVKPYLSLSGNGIAMPERVYASADYEQTPIIRTGIDNDGETGAGWSTSGTARQSSTADNTISWSGTFCSFGLDTNYSTGAGTLAWSVDGGAFVNINLSTLGATNQFVTNFTRGAHTVTIKVVSGLVKINRFLAI